MHASSISTRPPAAVNHRAVAAVAEVSVVVVTSMNCSLVRLAMDALSGVRLAVSRNAYILLANTSSSGGSTFIACYGRRVEL